ncbi:MAG TPA: glycosyltransferase [Candidatus Angelobacter sp.]
MHDSPRIFYFCYDHKLPLGGQKSTYQHVDALNRCGFDAAVVHGKRDYRLTWFENETRVIAWEDFAIQFDAARDYLVLPEDLGRKIAAYPGRKVVFNKGAYNGFFSLGFSSAMDPCLRQDVVAILTLSEHNRRHLQFAYPHLPVIRIWTAIDSSLFQFRTMPAKKPQIAYAPKSKIQLLTVLNMLKSRTQCGLNAGEQFSWILLQHKTESEVAEILGNSMAFVFCSVEEGCPRIPLEAMLCGCLPIAYGAGPLKEYLPRTLQCEYGNAIGMVRIIEQVMAWDPSSPFPFQKELDESYKTALTYSVEKQRETVCAAWETIFSMAGVSSPKVGTYLSNERMITLTH